MTEYLGKIVEFLDGDELQLGLVTRQTGLKLQVTDSHGRQHGIATKQVALVHRGGQLGEVQQRIQAAAAEVDVPLLWESVADELRDYGVEELAKSYFGSAEAVRQSALWRCLRQDPVRFKVKGMTIQPRAPAQVAAQQHAQQKQQEREDRSTRAVAWLREALAAATPTVPPDQAGTLTLVRDFLVEQQNNEAADWLAAAHPRTPPRLSAWQLLTATRQLPPGADRILLLAGISDRFPETTLAEAARLTAFAPTPGGRDFAAVPTWAIDDEDTREIDDAFSFQELAADRCRVSIHIAEVTGFVPPGSALDLEAARRSATLYLPHRRLTMFPERLSCDLASLAPGELRPTLSVVAEFDGAGELLDWQVVRGQLRLPRHLTYDEADALIAAPTAETGNALARLDRLTRILAARRATAGAINIQQPEHHFHVAGDGHITVQVRVARSVSRDLVAELMILYNYLIATYAARVDLPVIYRVQDPPAEPLVVPPEYDPVAFEGLFRHLRRSRFSLQAQPHAGLGVDAYTQASSPLRRYADLVIQRQLAAHLAGQPPPVSQPELLEVLGHAEEVERANRDVEALADYRFLLLYLQQEQARCPEYPARVLRPLAGGWLVETTDLYIRGRLVTPERLAPGTVYPVRVNQLDPDDGTLDFVLADRV